MLPLSVLDLSFITTAITGKEALANTIDLAQDADRLGYQRYWVAEHHNLPSVASGSPEVVIGHIAHRTRHIRVGSGGVMLPNHAPLLVAERFKVLEAFHPGRIDLGIGRAPGTDPLTSFALRHRDETVGRGGDDFLERFQELLCWKRREFPERHPFATVRAMPEEVDVPPIWLLGSSDQSAQLAGPTGLGFAFAHHFGNVPAAEAIGAYKSRFRPSADLSRPHAILATAAICAPTDEEAERLAATVDLNYVRRARGMYLPLASPEEALAHPWSAEEDRARRRNRQRVFVGSPTRVRDSLGAFAREAGADEIMVTSAIFDHEARKRSFALLAEAFDLRRPTDVVAAAA